MKCLAGLLLLCQLAAANAATPSTCLAVAPLAVMVRIGTGAPAQALLVGGGVPAMRLVDAVSGDLLWSAGATGAIQLFETMTAAFAGGFTALDLDHDGLADRLYAGDVDGRLWRFDLHHGAAAEEWASGGILADFSNAAGRGFLTAPDVSLATAPGSEPWFHIAIGTAAPGRVDAHNRFYVLRDHAPFDAWSDQQYHDWQALHETDLVQVDPTGDPAATSAGAGWFIELDQGDVLTRAITVAGRAVFAISQGNADPALGCRSAISIAAAVLASGTVLVTSEGWRRLLPAELALAGAFTMDIQQADAGTPSARCAFSGEHVAECDMDLRPRRTWWRREDAE